MKTASFQGRFFVCLLKAGFDTERVRNLIGQKIEMGKTQ
jgi:hypothetical protein